MSYVVLARKYRPQDFEALVGQTSVSQTLANALTTGRIAHAYVFSGPRGVGKTTTARILAKCLNCEKGMSLTPCNACASCVAITQGTSMQDVLEIDGASNRGIEQIRELRDNAKYAPASSRYRIFIIDEAHQITKDAFGALLKTLEEPPAHVVFMMATTEVQKIPAPILSRCQRFSLRPISPELVFNHLKDICKKEKLVIEDAAIADIVRFVEGSLRDALSLLDQAVVYAPNGITSQTFRELLGLLPLEVVRNFAQKLAGGNPSDILQAINHTNQNGIDLTQLGKDLQQYYHQLLLTKAGVKDPFNLNNSDLESAAKTYDYATLERQIRILAQALIEMRNSDTPRAVFELAALKIGQKVLDPRIILEKLEKISNQPREIQKIPTAAAPSAPYAAKPVAQVKNVEVPRTPIVEKKIEPQASASATTVLEAPAGSVDAAFIAAEWATVVHEIGAQKFSLGTALEEALVQPSTGKITLTFSKLFSQQNVQRSLPFVIDYMRTKWNWAPAFDLKLSDVPVSKPTSSPTMSSVPFPAPADVAEAEPEDTVEEISAEQASPEMQNLLKQFPGTLKRVKKAE